MTLESKLFELTTLVDYGTYYLTKANSKVVDLHYIADNFEVDDIYDDDTIIDFAKDHFYCFSNEDEVLEYITDRYSVGEVYDEEDAKEFLEGLGDLVFEGDRDVMDYVKSKAEGLFFEDEDEVIDWVKHNFALGDVAEWN